MAPVEFRVIITDEAFANLDSILDYIKLQSPQNAAAVIDRLLASIDGLKYFPHRFALARRISQQAGQETRSMPEPPFLVDYQIDETLKVVHVVTVIHGARRR